MTIMKTLALASAAALFAMTSLSLAQPVVAAGGQWADDPGYEEVNAKQGRVPVFQFRANTREFEPEVNPQIGLLPVWTPTRATNEGWVEVNAKQGRVPAFPHERDSQGDALAGH